MKAIVIAKTGGPEVLQVVQDHPMPSRGSGQVLVKLHSSSVNPVDTQIRSNKIPPKKLPKVLGGDLAGVVVEADAGSQFKKGDHVAALTMGFWIESPEGTYAEYAAVNEADLAKLPESVRLDTAAGVPLAGLTAWQALHEGKVEPGRRALIMAASGGVGHLAVQIAKALGMYVVGVAGPANAAWVKEHLGADEVIDYSKQDFAEVYAKDPFDVVVDCLPDTREKCLLVTKPDGHYSHIQNTGTQHKVLEELQEQHKQGKGPGVTLIFVRPNGKQLTEIYKLMDAGKVKLEVAKVFPLSQVLCRHPSMQSCVPISAAAVRTISRALRLSGSAAIQAAIAAAAPSAAPVAPCCPFCPSLCTSCSTGANSNSAARSTTAAQRITCSGSATPTRCTRAVMTTRAWVRHLRSLRSNQDSSTTRLRSG